MTTITVEDISSSNDNNIQQHIIPISAMKQPINESVQVAVNINNAVTASNATPPGWNAGRRFVARWVLWFVVITLLAGRTIWATFFSATSIIILKEGTFFSGKNIKWMILSAISFVASLSSWSLSRSADVIDEDRAYSLKMSLWIMAKSIQVIWGVILSVFLFSAATSKMSNPSSSTIAVPTTKSD